MSTSPTKTPLIVETRRGPCIAGTRITIFSVMDYLKGERSRDFIKRVRAWLTSNWIGQGPFLEAGLRETGWDQYLHLEFIRFRDLNVLDNATDQEIWRYVQREHFLLLTNNRHREDETSLQATIERENTRDSLPGITVSDQDRLVIPAYRQQAAHKLAEIVIYLDNYLGVGRVFIP